MPEFDWYQATIPRPVDDVLEALSGLAEGLSVGHVRPRLTAYQHCAVIGSERTGTVATVHHGGHNPHPHAQVTGTWAAPGAELIRVSFPEHRVARVDVREDYDGAGTYDKVQGQLLGVAGRMGVRVRCDGDHLLTKQGRTLYLGADKSPVRMRLYDKAAEMRAQLAIPRDVCPIAYGQARGIPEHLTRLEAQVRPHAKQKAAFAKLKPIEVLGASAWMREAWREVAGLELLPVQVGRGWQQSDDERVAIQMVKQYRRALLGMYADAGSWECVGLNIGELMKEHGSD